MDSLKWRLAFSLVMIVPVVFVLPVNLYQCPEECDCYQKPKPDDISVICRFTYLNFNLSSFNFSVLAPQNTIGLGIVCNRKGIHRRSMLKARMFQDLFRLEEIMLSHCYFDYIDEDVFAGLSNLRNLSIINALDLVVHPRAFSHLPNLEKLEIINCNWHSLSKDSLCGSKNIHTLVFPGNQIKSMADLLNLCSHLNSSFFSNLIKLDLDFNQIESLQPDFRQKLTSIQSLTLKGNNISEIQNDSLVQLKRLILLDVSNNHLTQIPDDFLSGSFSVRTLILSNNPITKLPPVVGHLKNLWFLFAENTFIDDITSLEESPLIALNIQNASLTAIPTMLCGKQSNLINLLLARNNISKIPPNLFKHCNRLKQLDLSSNNISTLFNDSFNGLENMIMLSLSDNKISNFAQNTFLAMPNLIQLNASFNLLPEIPLISKTLETVDLNNNQISYISRKNFSHFSSYSLEILLLADNTIEEIEDNAFEFLYKLSTLNLKNNKLTMLNQLTFTGLSRLAGLNIAHNQIADINLVLYNLKNLKILYAQFNNISTLRPNTFPVSIITIQLENNHIKTVEPRTFQNLLELKSVNLKSNQINTLSQTSLQIGNKMSVTSLYISGNRFECSCELAWMKKLSMMKGRLHSSYPVIQDLVRMVCYENGKPWLAVGMFYKIEMDRFLCEYKRSSYQKLPFICGVFCSCCYDETCYCRDTCPENCLCTHTHDYSVNRVDCTNANLTDGKGIPQNATWIDLSRNDLGYLTNATFNGKTMAETLYLNRSKMTGIGAGTFINFNRLKELHLEYNDITILDSSHLLGLQNLNKLILNHNKIERILPGTFNVTPSLEILDLSHNNLRKIESQTFDVDHLKSIILFDNPWSCECEDLAYLSHHFVTFSSKIKSDTILCNQTHIPILEYDNDFCRNQSLNSTLRIQSSVQDTRFVYALSIGMSLIVFAFIVGSILYAYRMEIQILLFVRFGWRILTKKKQLNEEDKIYDAFVSYHNSQDEFVVTQMLPRLETNATPAYKLCVHFRDFPVGAAIVDNIIESIENSKRTILLLTNEFLTSEWCRYEFQAAHLESLSNKMSNLIVVLLEDIDSDLVDGGLKLYMKTKTYLRYDDPRFWDKLRFALPEKKRDSVYEEKKK